MNSYHLKSYKPVFSQHFYGHQTSFHATFPACFSRSKGARQAAQQSKALEEELRILREQLEEKDRQLEQFLGKTKGF